MVYNSHSIRTHFLRPSLPDNPLLLGALRNAFRRNGLDDWLDTDEHVMHLYWDMLQRPIFNGPEVTMEQREARVDYLVRRVFDLEEGRSEEFRNAVERLGFGHVPSDVLEFLGDIYSRSSDFNGCRVSNRMRRSRLECFLRERLSERGYASNLPPDT